MLPNKKRRKLLIIIFFIIIFIIIKSFYGVKKVEESGIDILREKIKYAESSEKIGGTTYYVSSTGTSDDGTDINNPTSIEKLAKKNFYDNDKILFKRGDIFFGPFLLGGIFNKGELVYIGSYGDESLEKPIISGASILENTDAWEYKNGLYILDLTKNENFSGISDEYKVDYNVGFFRDEYGNIYGNRKKSLELLEKDGDFYIENGLLYLKYGKDPKENLGKIRIAYNNRLFILHANILMSGLIFEDTGGHAIWGMPINSCIKDCIIRNVGGSYTNISEGTRHGNGIEFWNCAKNTIVENCIIQNVYDAGYTLQGSGVTDGFYNNIFQNNILINCTYPIELSCHNNLETSNVKFENNKINNNIIINQGQGFGYETRPDRYQPASIVTWILPYPEEKLEYTNNRIYNPRALYYKGNYRAEDMYEKAIYSNNNTYYMNKDTIYFIDSTYHYEKIYLESQNLDINSKMNTISEEDILEISNDEILKSANYDEIKKYFDTFDIKYINSKVTIEIINSLEKVKSEYMGVFSNEDINQKYNKLINNLNKINNSKTAINETEILNLLDMQNDICLEVIEEQYKGNLVGITEETIGEMLEKIENISQKYMDIFSYYITTDNLDIKNIMNKLNETIDKYNNNNIYIDISITKALMQKAQNIYNNNIQNDNIYENVLNKKRIINIVNMTNKIIDTKIEKFIENEKAQIKLTYDRDTNVLTSENITVTLTIGSNTKIINNNGKNTYTFKANGIFEFEIEIKGESYKIPVTISNISKEFIIENNYIKNIGKETNIQDLKENLNIDNYSIIRNGQVLSNQNQIIATGDILKTNNAQYTLIVKGDITKDGDVSVKDLARFRRYLLDYINLDNAEEKAADSNIDGEVGIKDLVALRKLILE